MTKRIEDRNELVWPREHRDRSHCVPVRAVTQNDTFTSFLALFLGIETVGVTSTTTIYKFRALSRSRIEVILSKSCSTWADNLGETTRICKKKSSCEQRRMRLNFQTTELTKSHTSASKGSKDTCKASYTLKIILKT